MRQRQNGHHFADDILKYTFLNKKFLILNDIWLKFIPCGLIDNVLTWVQIMAWCKTGNKSLFHPMLTQFYVNTWPHQATMSYDLLQNISNKISLITVFIFWKKKTACNNSHDDIKILETNAKILKGNNKWHMREYHKTLNDCGSLWLTVITTMT